MSFWFFWEVSLPAITHLSFLPDKPKEHHVLLWSICFSTLDNKTTVRLLLDLMILTQSNILCSYAALVFMIWARIVLLDFMYLFSKVWSVNLLCTPSNSFKLLEYLPTFFPFMKILSFFFLLLFLPLLVCRFCSLLDSELSTVTDCSLFPLKKPTVLGCRGAVG